jgi:NADH-quinone oxidoreductase subunit E
METDMTAVNEAMADLATAERIIDQMGQVHPADLLPLLQKLQGAYGYLPAEVLREVTLRTGIPASRVHGVVTFYSQFRLRPNGRHTVRVCRGTACHVQKAGRVLDVVRRVLGIDEGQTTPDQRFHLETVACLGACFAAPAMMIDDQCFGRLTPQRIESILKNYEAKP